MWNRGDCNCRWSSTRCKAGGANCRCGTWGGLPSSGSRGARRGLGATAWSEALKTKVGILEVQLRKTMQELQSAQQQAEAAQRERQALSAQVGHAVRATSIGWQEQQGQASAGLHTVVSFTQQPHQQRTVGIQVYTLEQPTVVGVGTLLRAQGCTSPAQPVSAPEGAHRRHAESPAADGVCIFRYLLAFMLFQTWTTFHGTWKEAEYLYCFFLYNNSERGKNNVHLLNYKESIKETPWKWSMPHISILTPHFSFIWATLFTPKSPNCPNPNPTDTCTHEYTHVYSDMVWEDTVCRA